MRQPPALRGDGRILILLPGFQAAKRLNTNSCGGKLAGN